LRMLFEAKAECRFLFGDDVNNYLDSLHADYALLSAFTNSVIDQSQEGAPLFLEYLRLDTKVRYFWPFPPKKAVRDSRSTGASRMTAAQVAEKKLIAALGWTNS
jgi:hypothetical protein